MSVRHVRPARLLRLLPLALSLSIFFLACDSSEDIPDPSATSDGGAAPGAPARHDSSAAQSPAVARIDSAKLIPDSVLKFPAIRYSQLYITDKAVLDSVRRVYGKKKDTLAPWRVITTLNRKEFGYIRVGDTIVVPDTIVPDLRAYSVFPVRYPGADHLPKLIMVTNKYQAYACYEYGRLRRFAAANTGSEQKPTFPGRYALNWKARLKKSSLNDNWELPFTFNFHQYAGNAFHQFTMPGRPVSHSCIRQFQQDAEWLFNWGEDFKRDSAGKMIPFSGTPVVIVDVFDFARKRGGPWLDLASNHDQLVELPKDPMAVEEALIPISQIPKNIRGGLPNRKRYLAAEDSLRARGMIREGVHLSPSIDYNALRKARLVKRSKPQESPQPQVEEKKEQVVGSAAGDVGNR